MDPKPSNKVMGASSCQERLDYASVTNISVAQTITKKISFPHCMSLVAWLIEGADSKIREMDTV